MRHSITRDPKEYRRGMVLGLTLAETLLLLLFLLLLAVTALIWRKEHTIEIRNEQLRKAVEVAQSLLPFVQQLESAGVAGSAEKIIERIVRGEEAQHEVRRLQETLRAVRAQLDSANSRVSDLDGAVAALTREAQKGIQSSAMLSEAQARAKDAEQQRDTARQERDKAVAEQKQSEAAVANLASQLGLQEAQLKERVAQVDAQISRSIAEGMIAAGIYPSCWTTAGQAEFAFHVTLQTEGRIVVEDRASAARRSEEPWRLLDPFPRGVPIPVSTFVAATKKMSDWSQRQSPGCRFWISLRRDMPPETPNSEYLRVIGPLGNSARRHIPFYSVGG
jgi:hypothetical protein